MTIEDSDYLSIFDIELRKAQKIFAEANKKFIIKTTGTTTDRTFLFLYI